MLKKLTLLTLATMFLVCLGTGQATAEFKLEVQEFRLDNGLTVLMLENHTAPIITYHTYFKVGARNEQRFNSGISHFFEHMMFNGAAKYGPKQFDVVLEANGGWNNAWTSKNLTTYFETFPSETLELVLDLESDRMLNLALEDQMIKSESGVISEERLVGTDNDNTGLMWEELFGTAYMAHAYGSPVLGWMKSIKNFNREDCVEYHRTYYAPNNAVVAIVGDFKTDDALALVKKYFDSIPSGPPPPEVPNYEPEQRGAKRVLIEKAARHNHVMRGYHVVDKDSPELHVLEVVQFLLTTGESSRMHQALVNDLQLALYLYGGFEWSFDPTLFYFYIAVTPGVDYKAAELAFDSVLTDLTTNGPTDDELQKAKNGLTANFYKNFKTNAGTANELAQYRVLFGNWEEVYGFVDKIGAVTAEQVKETLAKYFKTKNSTTVVLVPEGDQS